MSVFTPLEAAELAALLKRWDLTLEGFSAATEGIENSNFLIDASDADGERRARVLTIFERTGYAELPPLVALLSRLSATGLPVPEPLPDRRGRCIQMAAGKPAVLVPRLPGRHPEQPDEALCQRLGEALARLHTGQVDPRGGMADAEQLAALAAGVLPGEDAAAVLAAWNQARQNLPGGLIHGDLFRDNVLVKEGEITGLLDFYCAGAGTWLFDLAVCLNDWAGPDAPALEQALLSGYQRVRMLSDAERKALPLALAAAALRFWLSRLETLSRERDGEGQVHKDPGEFEGVFRERFRGWRGQVTFGEHPGRG